VDTPIAKYMLLQTVTSQKKSQFPLILECLTPVGVREDFDNKKYTSAAMEFVV